MEKVKTYEEKKKDAAHLYLDGKCSLKVAIAICFRDPIEAIKALGELKDAFKVS